MEGGEEDQQSPIQRSFSSPGDQDELFERTAESGASSGGSRVSSIVTLINVVYKSIRTVVFSNKLNLLLPFGPAAILVRELTDQSAWVFFLSLVGIAPLAERLGYATEQLAFYTGPTVGGLLNATFGNATELIISIFALKSGLIRIVQLSLLGAILSDLLLVLGCAFFCGGLVLQKEQLFNKATAVVNSGLLLVAVMGLLLPTVLHYTHTEVYFGKSELALSRFSSCIMLVTYAAYLYFQLKSQRNLYVPLNEEALDDGWYCMCQSSVESIDHLLLQCPVIELPRCVSRASMCHEESGTSIALNIPLSFISVILLPLVGNAVDHASAITFAMKDKLDITLGVSIGASTQIALFVVDSFFRSPWLDYGASYGLKLSAFRDNYTCCIRLSSSLNAAGGQF
nr:vacuolar cation/proton exchanger 5 [Quercus suber]